MQEVDVTKEEENLANHGYMKDIVWNLIGQFAYLFGLWIITVLTTNVFEATGAGILGICLVAGNICGSLASFNLRLQYASDINKEYKDRQYIVLRFILTFASVIMTFCYALALSYTWEVIGAIMLFSIYKASEFVSDIFYGAMQRKGKLYIGGIFMTVKGVVSVAAYAIAAFASHNLYVSLAIMGIAVWLVTIAEGFYCFRILKVEFKLISGDWRVIWKLFLICIPLFVVLLCSNLLPSVPKIFFEKLYFAEEFGLYNSIATVAVLIQTAASSIALPIVPKISEMYGRGDKKGFLKWSGLTCTAVLVIGIIGVIAAVTIGDWALNLLYQGRVDEYAYTFVWTIVAGTATALFTIITQVLGGMHSKWGVMIASLAGTAICLAISYPFCAYQYVNGISFALMIAISIEIVVGLVFIGLGIKKMDSLSNSNKAD